MLSEPASIVFGGASCYGLILLGLRRSSWRSDDIRTNVKAISSAHAILTSGLVLYALSQPWPMSFKASIRSSNPGQLYLDESRNPMIHGHSRLGNAITSLETAYLLYDTFALVLSRQKDPVMVGHHLAFLVALGSLQVYIARGRERGVWIILVLLLMNASNPLLHYRWWRRRCTGKQSAVIDSLFVQAFALCRFGSVGFVLAKYSRFHGISILKAFARQRWVCQISTISMISLNAVWWIQMIRSMYRSLSKDRIASIRKG